MNAEEYVSQEIQEIQEDIVKAKDNPYVARLMYQPVSIVEYGADPTGVNDSAAAIQSAIDSLPNGGCVLIPPGTFLAKSTITVKSNIKLMGYASGKWLNGSRIHYTGTGPCIKQTTTNSNGVVLSNFKIYSASTDSNYQTFSGIEVNRAEWMTIEDVTISGANVGIDVSGASGAVYLLRIINPKIYNCLNEGIYVRNTTYYSNGIYIQPGDVSYNKIGIRCASGDGNVIEGKGTEVGINSSIGILLEGGMWTLKGSMWIENSPIGVQVTGGHHFLGDDIHCYSYDIQGGSLISNGKQLYSIPSFTGISTNGLKGWFSFNEGAGKICYDRSPNKSALTFTTTPTWDNTQGFYGMAVGASSTNKGALTANIINWTQDWTVMLLGKGTGGQDAFVINGADGINDLAFHWYKDGLQLYEIVSGTWNFKRNLGAYPGVDVTQKIQWVTLSYDSTNHKLVARTSSGYESTSYDYTISSNFSSPLGVKLGGNGVYVDEFILYQRYLKATEVEAITSSKSLPVFEQSTKVWECGTTSNRPPNPQNGREFFDSTLNKPIWFYGTNWRDAAGAVV